MIQEIFDEVMGQLQMDIDVCRELTGESLKAFRGKYAIDLDDKVYFTNSCLILLSKFDFQVLMARATALKESLHLIAVVDMPEGETSIHFVSYRDVPSMMEMLSESFTEETNVE